MGTITSIRKYRGEKRWKKRGKLNIPMAFFPLIEGDQRQVDDVLKYNQSDPHLHSATPPQKKKRQPICNNDRYY